MLLPCDTFVHTMYVSSTSLVASYPNVWGNGEGKERLVHTFAYALN